MKKPIIILLSLLVLCFAVTYSFAKATPQKQAQHKTFVGTVESVTMADPAKGTKSELAVTNEAKQKMTFVILPTTVIHDAQGKPTTLDKFKAGDKVTVRYATTAAGVNEAVSVKMVK
jgi:uncharacterized alpha/beta hydrolase family protein